MSELSEISTREKCSKISNGQSEAQIEGHTVKKWLKEKEQTMTYKTPHRNAKIEQHDTNPTKRVGLVQSGHQNHMIGI